MACREEDIPEADDTEVYDIASLSVLGSALGPNDINRANACLHRGRQLRHTDGRSSKIDGNAPGPRSALSINRTQNWRYRSPAAYEPAPAGARSMRGFST